MRKLALLVVFLGILCSATRGDAAEQSVADLVQALKGGDTTSQVQALLALEAKGPDAAKAVPEVIGLLKSSAAEVRAHAAETLGAIGPAAKSAAAGLAGVAAADNDPMVRREAVEALASIRPGPKVMLPILAQLLKDPDPAVRARVLGAVAERGAEAKELLLEALQNKETAYWACLVVSELGPKIAEAVPALTQLLGSEDDAVQREAALALAAIGEAAAPAAPKLETMIDDPLDSLAAIYALASIGKVSPEAKSKLVAKADSGKPFEKTVSAWALAKLHPDDERFVRKAVTLLVAALQSDDPQVRRAAAKGLGSLDGKPEIVRPIMLEALKKADEKTVVAMLDAMATLGPQIVPRLVSALEIEAARPYVCYILGQLGPAAAPAVDGLIKVLGDKNADARNEAIMALAEIGPAAKAAVPALTAIVKGGEKDRFAAAYALGRIGRDAIEAKPALLALLEGDEPSLALVSAWALAHIHPECPTCCEKAIPVLIAGLGDPEPKFRKEAAAGLCCFGKRAERAGEALKKALKDPDADVRKAVAEALKAIGQ